MRASTKMKLLTVPIFVIGFVCGYARAVWILRVCRRPRRRTLLPKEILLLSLLWFHHNFLGLSVLA
jgi:hypothetical protein